MKEQSQEQFPLVVISNNKAVTTSLEVARYFGKRHDDVLKAIRNVGCSDDFRLRNFAESNYTNEQGKQQPMCEMTRDGFTFVGMGFTGPQAARFREAYIDAFNRMEEALRRIQTEALVAEAKRDALTYFRRGAALTAVLNDRNTLEKVEKFYWFRVHGGLTHAEAGMVCCIEPQHACEIATALRDVGLALPMIQGQVRHKEISRFFAEAVGGFLPSDVRGVLADLRKEVAHV
jgi:Rha family phage regulatory protein